jgi:teichuronic acid biosynthesis glycosyltransferase TuaG
MEFSVTGHKMEANPLVSVITPVYNARRFVRRVVECVQLQRISTEHIIVDDCSTDGGAELLRELAAIYPSLRVILLAQNAGPAAARNAGMRVARGRFLAFLDADDLWMPEKLLIQTEHMLQNQIAISYTDYRFMSVDGSKVGALVRGPNRITRSRHFATRSGLGCLTVMIDRERVPGFGLVALQPFVDRAEDFWAWAEVLKGFDAYRVPLDLARYTVVPGSRSSNPFYKAKVIWRIYRTVEGLGLGKAIIYYLSFMVSAFFKRLYCAPRYNSVKVDGRKPRAWRRLVVSTESFT